MGARIENGHWSCLAAPAAIFGVKISANRLILLIILVNLARQANAHLRHVTTLSATGEQQRYWMRDRTTWWPAVKKHLIYAPFWKKRHHREKQLSRAINVGTLPSRLHTLILSLYLIANIIYCTLMQYDRPDKASVTAEIRGRTGHLAVVNMVGLFVLAGRNNPFIPLLHVSFDTFNLFHRWIGRLVILEALAHTLCWWVNKHEAEGSQGISKALTTDPFSQWGLVGTVCLVIILFQAPSAVRHAFYEIFLHLHQLLALLVMLATFSHIQLGNLPQMPIFITIITIWFYDRICRAFHLLYRNVSYRHGLTTVTVEALPGEACRLTFEIRRPWTDVSGRHVYAYLPSVSLWQSHPFSIAWSETRPTPYLSLENDKLPSSSFDLDLPASSRTTTSISLLISKRTGMTSRLYDRASASPTGIIKITGLVEGPYGTQPSLDSYGTVILVAGGIGITHHLIQIRALLAAYAEGRTSVRRIVLIWSVRTTEQLSWVRPWMDAVLAMPHRREVLFTEVYITQPKNAREVVSASQTVQMHAGRVKIGYVIKREFERRIGAMVVGVCGPGALADDVRDGARRVMHLGRVDFWEEGFSW